MTSATEVPPINSRQMVRRLVDLIREEKLAVGDRLPSIRALSERLAVSPSIVRDAMVQAQAMGLIKLHPRSGAFIHSLNFSTLVDGLTDSLPGVLMSQDHNLIYLLDARRTIEVENVAQAARRRRLEDMLPTRRCLERMAQLQDSQECVEYVMADIEFHLCLAQAAGNPVMCALLESIMNCLRPYLLGLAWTTDRRQLTEQSHAVIYEAVLNGDVEAARAAMSSHIGLARDSLLKEVQEPLRTA